MKLLIRKLCSDPGNTVYLMSGRQRSELAYYAAIPNLGISAENGCFLKLSGRTKWETTLRDDNSAWRRKVLEIFDYYTEYLNPNNSRTPGSYVENKEVNIVWNYGHADINFGSWQAAECNNHIANTIQSNYPIHALATKKRIEVMPRNVSKATIIRQVLQYHRAKKHSAVSSAERSVADATSPGALENTNSVGLFEDGDISPAPEGDLLHAESPTSQTPVADPFDFICCIGDDRNDEVMFEYLLHINTANSEIDTCEVLAIPTSDRSPTDCDSCRRLKQKSIITATVGSKSSAAKWYIESVHEVIRACISLE